jgi:enoyl-CoA hydratase/carnithine racemase
MGLSKANELLLLGKEIDASTAVAWGIGSVVDTQCDMSGDPFHPNSLASRMAIQLQERLLSLPQGFQTAYYFVSLIRGRRRQCLEQVCREELQRLDERFDTGQVLEAAHHLHIGSARSTTRSKL